MNINVIARVYLTYAIVPAFLQRGGVTIIKYGVDRGRKNRIDAIVKEISAAGGKAMGFAADVTKRAEVEALIKGAVDSFGRVDVLVNNAGFMPIAPIPLLKVEEWDRQIDVNIRGVLCGVAAPQNL
jgi:NADP-dependent 3-hydroxy acid dehydrogenase YdfG